MFGNWHVSTVRTYLLRSGPFCGPCWHHPITPENYWGIQYSPNSACTWGSHGVDKGPLKGVARPLRCRRAFFLVIYSTWWYLPSKTHSKIDILKELLTKTLCFTYQNWSDPLKSSLGHPWDPRAPASSQIPLREYPNCSQVLLRCFKNYNFGYESGPHGSPQHDTLSQRSATPPPAFLTTSQAPETPFSTQKLQKK